MLVIYIDGFSFVESKILTKIGFLMKYIIHKEITLKTEFLIFKNSRFIFSYMFFRFKSFKFVNSFWILLCLRLGYFIKYKEKYFSYLKFSTFISKNKEYEEKKKKLEFFNFFSFLNLNLENNIKTNKMILKKIVLYKKILIYSIKTKFFATLKKKKLKKTTNYIFNFLENIKNFIRLKLFFGKNNILNNTKPKPKKDFYCLSNCENGFYKIRYNEPSYLKLFILKQKKIPDIQELSKKCCFLIKFVKIIFKKLFLIQNNNINILIEFDLNKNKKFDNFNILKFYSHFWKENRNKILIHEINIHLKKKCDWKFLKKDFSIFSFVSNKISIKNWNIQTIILII